MFVEDDLVVVFSEGIYYHKDNLNQEMDQLAFEVVEYFLDELYPQEPIRNLRLNKKYGL